MLLVSSPWAVVAMLVLCLHVSPTSSEFTALLATVPLPHAWIGWKRSRTLAGGARRDQVFLAGCYALMSVVLVVFAVRSLVVGAS